MRHVPLLLLSVAALGACGGQSGENRKGGDTATCEVVASEPLAGVPESDWPEGLAELVTAYRALAGDWSATFACLDEPDAAATFSLVVDPDLLLQTYAGDACGTGQGVAGTTGFALSTADFSAEQDLGTGFSAGSGAAHPILMTGTGVELAWDTAGDLDSAIDKYRWQNGNSQSDATCELLGPHLEATP